MHMPGMAERAGVMRGMAWRADPHLFHGIEGMALDFSFGDEGCVHMPGRRRTASSLRARGNAMMRALGQVALAPRSPNAPSPPLPRFPTLGVSPEPGFC